MIDAVAENPAIDVYTVDDWCCEAVGETTMMIEDPVGPKEKPMSDEAIEAVTRVLEHAASVTTFFKRDRTKKEAEPEPTNA